MMNIFKIKQKELQMIFLAVIIIFAGFLFITVYRNFISVYSSR